MKISIQQAINAHKDGKLEEAESLYQEILKTEPLNPDANHNLGVLKLSINNSSEALPLFKVATEVNPDIVQFWMSYGNALMQENQLEESETSYKKAIELDPNLAEAHNNLATIQEQQHRFEASETSLKKSIELKPNFALAYKNLGSLMLKTGRLEEAEKYYKKTIEIKKDSFESYNNLGGVMEQLEKLEQAEFFFRKTIELKPDYAEGYNNLGSILFKLKKLDEALVAYNKAIELKPDYKKAFLNRGQVLFDKKEWKLSLMDFDQSNDSESRVRSLYSLYALGKINEIYKRIEINSEIDKKDLKVAAFSAFIYAKEKKKIANKFCNNPLDFIKFSNLSSHIKDSNSFINKIIKELDNIKSVWEPQKNTTSNGFHSVNEVNLFENPTGKLSNLKSMIINEINLYQSKFKDKTCTFIKEFTNTKNLRGWYVVLKQQGYQKSHIHPSGWLSGVIYLKVVPSLGINEGSIEFSLNGVSYSDKNIPKLTHNPNIGDIILFPSSLHHRTIPYSTNSDRIIISFDLIPKVQDD